MFNDKYLFRDWILEEAKKIDQEISKVDFEKEYGLTPERTEEIKQRIYHNIIKEVEKMEQEDSE